MINPILIFQLHQRNIITSLDILIRILNLNYYNLKQQTRSSSQWHIYSNAQNFRSPLFLDQHRGQAIQAVLDYLTPKNGTDRLTRNVSN